MLLQGLSQDDTTLWSNSWRIPIKLMEYKFRTQRLFLLYLCTLNDMFKHHLSSRPELLCGGFNDDSDIVSLMASFWKSYRGNHENHVVYQWGDDGVALSNHHPIRLLWRCGQRKTKRKHIDHAHRGVTHPARPWKCHLMWHVSRVPQLQPAHGFFKLVCLAEGKSALRSFSEALFNSETEAPIFHGRT